MSNERLRAGIREYCAWRGLPAPVEGHYVTVDEARARRIAEEFERLPKWSERTECQDAYAMLAAEVRMQYDWATNRLGYRVEEWTREGQPYATSAEMMADVEGGHLWVFADGERHRFLGPVNVMLRAIHDLYGHAAEGFQFGPRGEENAWLHHSMMFSELAQRALTTETRGQNCWVNFGPYSHLPASERPFAVQKVALLPAWVWDWQAVLLVRK